jgi:hypothetical protein
MQNRSAEVIAVNNCTSPFPETHPLILSRQIPILRSGLGFRSAISKCHRVGSDHDDSSYHMCESLVCQYSYDADP